MALTKHPEGSLKELFSIALPLMLSSLSAMGLIFVDRLLLSFYSLDAFRAAANAATLGWAFMIFAISLGCISEAFCAQHHGAKEYNRMGEPVWQMIWMGLASFFVFIPIAFIGSDLFFQGSPYEHYEKQYFFWMMVFGSGFSLVGALTGFFIAQGKTILITMVAVGTNLVNVVLDIILIFGIEGFIPSMGAKGAAIATSASSIVEALVLLMIFLKTTNREAYGTARFAFQPDLAKKCLRFGIPAASFGFFEVLAYAAYYRIMTNAGETYITIATICQSLLVLLFFTAEGVNKAVVAIAGNMIGAKKTEKIGDLIRSGTLLHFIFFSVFLSTFLLFSRTITDLFLTTSDSPLPSTFYWALKMSVVLGLIHLFFEGIRMVLGGILTAAGDTLFLMWGGSFVVWGFLVVPLYISVNYFHTSVVASNSILAISAILATIVYSIRFFQGNWQEIDLHFSHSLQQTETSVSASAPGNLSQQG